jgi:hypothetical protein
MKSKYLAVILLSIATLSGCGGSDDAASTTTTLPAVAITDANASTVANAAVTTALSSATINSVSPLSVQAGSTVSAEQRMLYKINDMAMQKALSHNNVALNVTTAATTINPCTNGGNYTVSSDGADLATSTYQTVTFNNCTESPTTLNGSFSITGLSTSTTNQAVTISINLTGSANGNVFSFVGGYSYTATGMGTTTRTDTIAGSSIVTTYNGLKDALTNFSFSSVIDSSVIPNIYTDTIYFTVSSDFVGGSFSFATTAGRPIVSVSDINRPYPISGQAVVTGANNSKLRITIIDTNPNAGTSSGTVSLEVSTNGTTYGSPVIRTWTQISNS